MFQNKERTRECVVFVCVCICTTNGQKNESGNLCAIHSGNAWTDAATENRAAVEFWHSHGIISTAAKDGMRLYCDFSAVGPLLHSSSISGVSIVVSM